MRLPALVCALACASLLGAPAAFAGQADDFEMVRADWQRDGTITPCRFSEEELRNAKAVAEGNPDLAYTSFPSEVDRELTRRGSRACAGRTPDSVRRTSPLARVRIVAVSGRGRASRESLRITNGGRRTVSLGGASLRNRSGGLVRLPRGLRLRAGRTLTVRIGCAPGQRRPSFRGSRAFACSRRALFADSGDVARLVDRRRVAVSQRGFGRFRRAARF